MRDLERFIWFWFALTVGLLFLQSAHSCHAQMRMTPAQALLAFDVARVATGEAPGSLADVALIWQVTARHGFDAQNRRRWLQSHSPCHTGALTEEQALRRPGNCRWARGLRPDGRQPAGWDERQDGPWARTRLRWRAALRLALRLVSGREKWLPCNAPVLSWDGRRWVDELADRGWRAVSCKGTANVGVVRSAS